MGTNILQGNSPGCLCFTVLINFYTMDPCPEAFLEADFEGGVNFIIIHH